MLSNERILFSFAHMWSREMAWKDAIAIRPYQAVCSDETGTLLETSPELFCHPTENRAYRLCPTRLPAIGGRTWVTVAGGRGRTCGCGC